MTDDLHDLAEGFLPQIDGSEMTAGPTTTTRQSARHP